MKSVFALALLLAASPFARAEEESLERPGLRTINFQTAPLGFFIRSFHLAVDYGIIQEMTLGLRVAYFNQGTYLFPELGSRTGFEFAIRPTYYFSRYRFEDGFFIRSDLAVETVWRLPASAPPGNTAVYGLGGSFGVEAGFQMFIYKGLNIDMAVGATALVQYATIRAAPAVGIHLGYAF